MKFYHEKLVVLCSVYSNIFFIESYDEIVFLKVTLSANESGVVSEDV